MLRGLTFEPQLVGKGQRRLDGFDEKILALYAKGMTTRDIQDIVKDLYGVEVSPTLVSEISADLDTEVSAWRTRRLDGVWPSVYLDGIVVHVRGENGRVIRKAIYTTNAIESVNSVIWKFTRNRKQYPNGESALKLVYLAIHEASKKWTMPLVDWDAALNHFAIVFEGRMPTRPTN